MEWKKRGWRGAEYELRNEGWGKKLKRRAEEKGKMWKSEGRAKVRKRGRKA